MKLKINELYKDKENLLNKLNENQNEENINDNQFSSQEEKIHPIINNAINMIKTKGNPIKPNKNNI